MYRFLCCVMCVFRRISSFMCVHYASAAIDVDDKTKHHTHKQCYYIYIFRLFYETFIPRSVYTRLFPLQFMLIILWIYFFFPLWIFAHFQFNFFLNLHKLGDWTVESNNWNKRHQWNNRKNAIFRLDRLLLSSVDPFAWILTRNWNNSNMGHAFFSVVENMLSTVDLINFLHDEAHINSFFFSKAENSTL